MKYLKYFFQFLFITFLLIFFKFIGLKLSRVIAGNIFLFLGPLFRSKKTIAKNILIAFPNTNQNFRNNIKEKCGKIMEKY
jgi:KDO2-lipid IV(A) lauroyltransferase